MAKDQNDIEEYSESKLDEKLKWNIRKIAKLDSTRNPESEIAESLKLSVDEKREKLIQLRQELSDLKNQQPVLVGGNTFMTLKELRDKIEWNIHEIGKLNSDFPVDKKLKAISTMTPLQLTKRLLELRKLRDPKSTISISAQPKPDAELDKSLPYFMRGMTPRLSADELFKILSQYDVISFDIFDTAVLRRLEYHDDIFHMMAIEIGCNEFQVVRRSAERDARDIKEKSEDTREVNIDEIYEILEKYYGIDSKWKDREIKLELSLCEPNPVILDVYNRLKNMGKTLVFMSDTCLKSETIKSMLEKCGYSGYEKIFLSSDYGTLELDGSLQPELVNAYPDKFIVHIGDNWGSDVVKTAECGISTIYYPAPRLAFREPYLESIAGNFYRGLMNNRLASGNFVDENIYYTHGWRIGGILTAGFCQFVDQVAKSQNAEKILFCARDCDVISKAYKKYWNHIPSEYIQISQYAIFEATTDRYLYEFLNQTVLKALDEYQVEKPLREILQDCGFDYLVDDLESFGLEQCAFPRKVENGRKLVKDFMFANADKIREHCKSHVDAARKYFRDVIGDARKILIVDIGISQTRIDALKYFLETQFPDKNLQIHCALLASHRNRTLINALELDAIQSYAYSPFHNLDLAKIIMPLTKISQQDLDILQMPLKYLFTSTEASLVSYELDENGEVKFLRTSNVPKNIDQIESMQDGILEFLKEFRANLKCIDLDLNSTKISPYLALNPLIESFKNKDYIHSIYREFLYERFSSPFGFQIQRFGEFLGGGGHLDSDQEIDPSKRILFVSQEMLYTGAPTSLIRMCKVARDLGYYPYVWSKKAGSFMQEFEKENIPVAIVTEKDLQKPEIGEWAKRFSMAMCNTIITDRYVRFLEKLIPVAWYIREAQNIPKMLETAPVRAEILRDSKNLVCVSEYASDAIRQYSKHLPTVIHNCIEDESSLAIDYTSGQNEKIRFVQFGSISRRKGYDAFVEAYLAMPEDYRAKSEIYFAGPFIATETEFASQLFHRIKGESNIHYLGIIRGSEKKIETLSSMDVVVVASRDESCSLVALEGAMLSKPLIVTENVGAKYMIDGGNGKIVETADVDSLRDAMMYMIDNREKLESMGIQSRKNYESMANMDSYKKDLANLFERKINGIIVSLTTYSMRTNAIVQTVKSLLDQTVMPEKILLWLSEENFPDKESELPQELLDLRENPMFEICFIPKNLEPHKKYYYAMQEYPNHPIIVVNSDEVYDNNLIELLFESYKEYPNSISCMRSNRVLFKNDVDSPKYQTWHFDVSEQSTQGFVAVGADAVLYPYNLILMKK